MTLSPRLANQQAQLGREAFRFQMRSWQHHLRASVEIQIQQLQRFFDKTETMDQPHLMESQARARPGWRRASRRKSGA